ncbi:thiol-disulfide oxidoreductase DCC family protein [Ornithinibacillus bavariensis]|uniref:thiol-disulfide oxidoreductase DCC family protein n=1 Tax=Ornithinibacillus bavariensis TaxID=545502 RepID=UPI000ED57177|nr:thiol-disulfide oxidoreductase [Ornithinibacillus sp.]
MRRVILFDGVCNFCNSSVQFIIKRDPTAKFHFASLQSEIGQQLLNDYQIPKDIDSFIYLEGEEVYVQSTAALKVSKELKGLWKLCYVFIVVPRPIRNIFYNLFAKNRYSWFGKRESCMIPSQLDRQRFLE